MVTDRKRIQALLDELEENHTVQEFHLSSKEIDASNSTVDNSSSSTPVEQHDGGAMSDTSDRVFSRILAGEESIDEEEGAWVNKEEFPNVKISGG